MRSPGRLPTLARWSSSRRLWELAMRSKRSSVCGEAVSEGWAVGDSGEPGEGAPVAPPSRQGLPAVPARPRPPPRR